ncbi:MAG: MJ1255/VC2487 family glycosyltransferase [archaeon]|jgi:uncharacterized protein (TIGR00661 family)
MKIIYALNSDGFGHVTRSIPIIDHLLKKGHKIQIITDESVANFLEKKYPNIKIDVVKQPVFVYSKEGVKLAKSFFGWFNAKNAKNLTQTTKIIYNYKPDIIISDLERYTLWAGKMLEIPTIEIDNHATIFRGDVEFKAKDSGDFFQAKAVSKLVYPFANYYFGLCFYRTNIVKKNTEVFDPIFMDEIKKFKSKDKGYILVYNRFMEKTNVTPVLKKIKTEKFIVFGYNQDKIDGNITFKKNEPNLFKYISECKAIITNGGHTLITEALYFKKPIYSIPMKHQFEQLTNAHYLDILGYGESHTKIDEKSLKQFLINIPKYKQKLKNHKYQDSKLFLKRVDEKIEELVKQFKNI